MDSDFLDFLGWLEKEILHRRQLILKVKLGAMGTALIR